MSSKTQTGLFITLEGGEGSGKTTLTHRLAKKLIDGGHTVVTTREPGGTRFGDHMRQWLLHHSEEFTLGSKAELLLFLAARAQHVEERIRPDLQSGNIVICDRFNDSTTAYQGIARGLGIDAIQDLCLFVCGNVVPDLTLYLDIDPRLGLARSKQRGSTQHDRVESEDITFHNKVRQGFLDLALKEPQRIHVIDASLSPDDVFQQAWDEVTKAIKTERIQRI